MTEFIPHEARSLAPLHASQTRVKCASDELLRALWVQGATFEEMARRTGRSRWGAYNRATSWLRLHRSHPRPPGYKTPGSSK